MLGSELSNDLNDISTTVLGQSSGDTFKGIGNSLKGQLFKTFNALGELKELGRDGHFSGTTTGDKLGVDHDVLGNSEGILQVSFHFVQDILGGTSEEDGASLGVLAFNHEGEVVITNLSDVEETTLGTNIRFLDFFRSVDDLSTSDSGNSVVISLSDTTNAGDVLLKEVMLSQIRNTLFSDDDIGLVLHDVVAHIGDFFHFFLEGRRHVIFLGHFHVGLGFTLLVFQSAIQKKDSGVFNGSSHLGVDNIFIEHNTIQNLAFFKETSGNFFNFSISLGINGESSIFSGVAHHDGSHTLESQFSDGTSPSGCELSSDAALNSYSNIIIFININGGGNFLENLHGLFEGLEVSANNDGGMHLSFEEGCS
mmetsp:Transcript_41206/g.36542  ORF Transcript_41206/g.36542 Transcript_41206/m.36542 type:complete len:366 (+) Transcript_41206:689-1786(+)